jgi:hypothetical protein
MSAEHVFLSRLGAKTRDAGLCLLVSQQGLVLRIDSFVALAGRLSQAVHAENLNLAPRVFDHARPLQGVRYARDAGAPYPEHFGKKFLGEQQRIAAGQIPRQAVDCCA